MAQIANWYERKFEFAFPVELYPNICARLRGTPARIEELLHGRAPDVLTRKINGKWSAQEHAGHLLELEPLWIARVNDYPEKKTELTVADLSNRKTDEAAYNQRPLKPILEAFRAARFQLVNQLENIDSGLFGRSLLHPRLKKPMRLVDHLFFVAEHDDHHLAKMWELVRTK
jgi:uncharacterized damage-inducible protein DinB